MCIKTEVLGRPGPEHQLFHGPLLPFLRFAVHLRWGKSIERLVIGRVHSDELPLQMRRQFGDLDAMFLGCSLHLFAIALRLRRFPEIQDAFVPARDLHALVAERCCPFANSVERVERRLIAGELCQKNTRSLDVGGHVSSPLNYRYLLTMPSRYS